MSTLSIVLVIIALMFACYVLGVQHGIEIPKEKYYLMGWNDCRSGNDKQYSIDN